MSWEVSLSTWPRHTSFQLADFITKLADARVVLCSLATKRLSSLGQPAPGALLFGERLVVALLGVAVTPDLTPAPFLWELVTCQKPNFDFLPGILSEQPLAGLYSRI